MQMNKEVILDDLGSLVETGEYQNSPLSDNKYLNQIRRNLKKIEHDAEQTKIWSAIYRYSLIKMNKTCIEQCFAPHALPEDLNRKLNDQIEYLRDSLLDMLHPQQDK